MSVCMVDGCPGDGEKLFRFPPSENKTLYESWLKVSGFFPREALPKHLILRVCSSHFTSKDFVAKDESSPWIQPKSLSLLPSSIPWLKVSYRFQQNNQLDRPNVKCCIRGCKAIGQNLYKFPEITDLRFLFWMDSCCQNGEKKDPQNYKDAYVCRVHFEDEDVIRTTSKQEALNVTAIPKLYLKANLAACCCVPFCREGDSFNTLDPVLVPWPVSNLPLSELWFKSLGSVLDKSTLTVDIAKVCTRHFLADRFFEEKKSNGFFVKVLKRASIPEVVKAPNFDPFIIREKIKCCVYNCRAQTGSRCYKFPPLHHGNLRRLWIAACVNEGGAVDPDPEKDFVCEKHFRQDNFYPVDGKQNLKSLAVPEIFKTCIVAKCPTNIAPPSLNEKIKVFYFPKDPEVRMWWYAHLGFTPTDELNLSVVGICERHFSQNDFSLPPLEFNLKTDAVPSKLINSGGGRKTKNFRRVLLEIMPIDGYLPKAYTRKRSAQKVSLSINSDLFIKRSRATQLDTMSDFTTLCCLRKIEYLEQQEAELDDEIIKMEIENHDLEIRPDKLAFLSPVFLG